MSILCYEYYINLPGTDLFLQGPPALNVPPYFAEKSTRNKFKLVFAENSKTHRIFYISEHPSDCLDIADYKDKVIYYPFHNSKNQKFELLAADGINKFRILYEGKCFTWSADKKEIHTQICTERGDNQIFGFICADCPKEQGDTVEKDFTKKGFYTEYLMSMLHAIENMSHEFTYCFLTNNTCNEHFKGHPLLYFSPFDPAPVFSGDWSELENLGVNFDVRFGDKKSQGNYNLTKDLLNKIEAENIKKAEKECECSGTPSHFSSYNHESNLHGNTGDLTKNVQSILQEKKTNEKIFLENYIREAKVLQSAIDNFKSNVSHALESKSHQTQKIESITNNLKSKHMMPQHSDIMYHDTLHEFSDGSSAIHSDKENHVYKDQGCKPGDLDCLISKNQELWDQTSLKGSSEFLNAIENSQSVKKTIHNYNENSTVNHLLENVLVSNHQVNSEAEDHNDHLLDELHLQNLLEKENNDHILVDSYLSGAVSSNLEQNAIKTILQEANVEESGSHQNLSSESLQHSASEEISHAKSSSSSSVIQSSSSSSHSQSSVESSHNSVVNGSNENLIVTG
ncbi:hypothetical protein GVAV_003419 [Gurleya vavrai]